MTILETILAVSLGGFIIWDVISYLLAYREVIVENEIVDLASGDSYQIRYEDDGTYSSRRYSLWVDEVFNDSISITLTENELREFRDRIDTELKRCC